MYVAYPLIEGAPLVVSRIGPRSSRLGPDVPSKYTKNYYSNFVVYMEDGVFNMGKQLTCRQCLDYTHLAADRGATE